MLAHPLNPPNSPYYWAFVGAITLAFAIVDFEALRRRSMSRFHGFSVAVYVLTWVVVLGLALPVAPVGGLWWVFPAGVRVAVGVMFLGGQLLADLTRGELWIAHPERREPALPRPELPADELREAEEYDAYWQAEDRQRNHDLALHAREETAHRKAATRLHDHPPSGLG